MTTHESEIDLLSIWRPIRQRWRYILFATAASAVLGVIISLVLPKTYTAETLLLPLTDTPSSMGAAQSIMGGLGLGVGSKATSQTSKLMTILKSRTMAEAVIQNHDFLKRIYEKQWDEKNNRWKDPNPQNQPSLEDAAAQLKNAVSVSSDLEHGTIKVTADASTPAFAYDIVLAYIKTLQKFIAENALTQAKYKRLSIEKQLIGNKRALLMAGRDFTKYAGRVSSEASEVDIDLDEDKNFGGEFLAGLEEDGLNATIMKDAIDHGTTSLVGGDTTPMKRVPQTVYLQYITLQKDILARTNSMLTQQYELAKIEEAKNDLLFQVIDRPLLPKNKSKPNRRAIVMGFFFGSLFLSSVGAVILDKSKTLT